MPDSSDVQLVNSTACSVPVGMRATARKPNGLSLSVRGADRIGPTPIGFRGYAAAFGLKFRHQPSTGTRRLPKKEQGPVAAPGSPENN